jgi:hypothetical protein
MRICPINLYEMVCKVRISDHYATNSVRQATEIMVDHVRFNIDELMTLVDRAMYPALYEQVQIRTLTGDVQTSKFQVGNKPFTTLSEPTFLGEVIGKKGNLLHSYSWMKEDVRYAWVKNNYKSQSQPIIMTKSERDDAIIEALTKIAISLLVRKLP